MFVSKFQLGMFIRADSSSTAMGRVTEVRHVLHQRTHMQGLFRSLPAQQETLLRDFHLKASLDKIAKRSYISKSQCSASARLLRYMRNPSGHAQELRGRWRLEQCGWRSEGERDAMTTP